MSTETSLKSVQLHLISPPFAALEIPSIQLGALKAYIDQQKLPGVHTHCYTASLAVFYRMSENLCFDSFNQLSKFREYAYYLLFLQRFGRQKLSAAGMTRKRLLEKIQRIKPEVRLTWEKLSALEAATKAFVDEELIPSVLGESSALHVFGFTLTYDQLYSSAYIARHLEEALPVDAQKRFIFGGYGAGIPQTGHVVREAGLDALLVPGEGERKLVAVIRALQNGGTGLKKALLEPQIENMSELPEPDYAEFFERAGRLAERDVFFKRQFRPELLVEGTRGCFAKCDFCGLNIQWDGFRKSEAKEVFARALAMTDRYRLRSIRFVDNVCDTWAGPFSEFVTANGGRERFDSVFMELRAHHPEQYWTGLALAGLTRVQIGVESLAEKLLKQIGKGTRVIQNLAVMKHLRELGVRHFANIITHHPKSTFDDILETKKWMRQSVHLDPLELSEFCLVLDSPIFKSAFKESRERPRSFTRLRFGKKADALRELAVEYCYETPRNLKLSDEVHEGWDAFTVWYRKHYLKTVRRGARFEVKRQGAGFSTVYDSRFSSKGITRVLEGERHELFQACARPVPAVEIELRFKRAVIEELLRDKLLLRSEGFYLTLATRPRSVLVDAYLAQKAIRSPRENPVDRFERPSLSHR